VPKCFPDQPYADDKQEQDKRNGQQCAHRVDFGEVPGEAGRERDRYALGGYGSILRSPPSSLRTTTALAELPARA
jgi:hypothetical protein